MWVKVRVDFQKFAKKYCSYTAKADILGIDGGQQAQENCRVPWSSSERFPKYTHSNIALNCGESAK
jgi:hypothetical protein